MTINKAKASSYNTVNTDRIIDYINGYLKNINELSQDMTPDNMSRSALKQIAAELETIEKQMKYHIHGIY